MILANLQTTLLLEVFSKDAGDCDPSRLVFALIKSLGLEGVPVLGGGIPEPEGFLWLKFILFILSSSSLPMVFDLTRGNLDRIDNRWKPSLCRNYIFWDSLNWHAVTLLGGMDWERVGTLRLQSRVGAWWRTRWPCQGRCPLSSWGICSNGDTRTSDRAGRCRTSVSVQN